MKLSMACCLSFAILCSTVAHGWTPPAKNSKVNVRTNTIVSCTASISSALGNEARPFSHALNPGAFTQTNLCWDTMNKFVKNNNGTPVSNTLEAVRATTGNLVDRFVNAAKTTYGAVFANYKNDSGSKTKVTTQKGLFTAISKEAKNAIAKLKGGTFILESKKDCAEVLYAFLIILDGMAEHMVGQIDKEVKARS